MKLTKRLIDEHKPCQAAVEWLSNQKEKDVAKLIELLIKEDRLDWANWAVARILNRPNKIRYAIYSAELVIGDFEKQYPDDKRPREAINAAKNYLKSKTKKEKESAARSAESAARSAARSAESAASAARSAARSAESAARSAAWSAESAASAARSAESAARSAARSAAWSAASAARSAARSAASAASEMKIKIIRYGLSMFKKQRVS